MKIFFSCLFALTTNLLASQTVGAIFNFPGSSNNLTLVSPTNYNKSYLINNCGEIYKEWESEYNAGQIAQLDSVGNLYRAGRQFSSTFGVIGGVGGKLQKFSWDGELIWEITITNDSLSQHHDIELLPNGNLLVLIWKRISADEAINLGRDPSQINESGFVSEIIREIKVNGNEDFEVVWEWDALDHLIQSYDINLPNYGLTQNFPGKIDINLSQDFGTVVDWLHFNSIDFNPELNQILVSARELNEIIILDKSTTTEEASTSLGGKSNRGGDLICRWGNPSNYSNDPSHDQLLFRQHDANWILDEFPGAGNIILFNNGSNRPGDELYSTVDEIKLNFTNNEYDFLGKEDMQQEDVVWSYNNTNSENLFSAVMSGAKRLQNGNTLITESRNGRVFEVSNENEIERSYILPVNNNGPIAQNNSPSGNTLFKAISYPKSFFVEELKLINTFEKIELFPTENCEIHTATINPLSRDPFSVAYNVQKQSVEVELENKVRPYINVYNSIGEIVSSGIAEYPNYSISTLGFPRGVYFISLIEENKLETRSLFIY